MVTIETPRSPRSRKGARFEKWAWIYMRVSGIALIVLIFTHLFVNLYITGISAINFAFVAGKWADPLWQWWDGIMLWLALIHGSNGMRVFINDYTTREGLRKFLNGALAVTCVSLIVLGTLVITTFDPCIDSAVNDIPAIAVHCVK